MSTVVTKRVWLDREEYEQRQRDEDDRIEREFLARMERIETEEREREDRAKGRLPRNQWRKCPTCSLGFIYDGQVQCQSCIPTVPYRDYYAVARITQRPQTVAAKGEVKNP
jgi:hypothetical protein